VPNGSLAVSLRLERINSDRDVACRCRSRNSDEQHCGRGPRDDDHDVQHSIPPYSRLRRPIVLLLRSPVWAKQAQSQRRIDSSVITRAYIGQ
jgi:hypothetical protein